MPTIGAQLVIFNHDRSQTLLIKREDFRIWTVPVGGLSQGNHQKLPPSVKLGRKQALFH